MVKIQRIYKTRYSSRTYSNFNINGEIIGLFANEKVYIFEKEDSLLYTHEMESPDPEYTIYKVQKVEAQKSRASNQSNRSQVTLPAEWVKKYCKDLTHVKVNYTCVGVFIEPCEGEI